MSSNERLFSSSDYHRIKEKPAWLESVFWHSRNTEPTARIWINGYAGSYGAISGSNGDDQSIGSQGVMEWLDNWRGIRQSQPMVHGG